MKLAIMIPAEDIFHVEQMASNGAYGSPLYGAYDLDTWKVSGRSQFLYASNEQKQMDE